MPPPVVMLSCHRCCFADYSGLLCCVVTKFVVRFCWYVHLCTIGLLCTLYVTLLLDHVDSFMFIYIYHYIRHNTRRCSKTLIGAFASATENIRKPSHQRDWDVIHSKKVCICAEHTRVLFTLYLNWSVRWIKFSIHMTFMYRRKRQGKYIKNSVRKILSMLCIHITNSRNFRHRNDDSLKLWLPNIYFVKYK